MQYPDQDLRRILFIDIETASASQNLHGLSDRAADLWRKKMVTLHKYDISAMEDDDWERSFQERAAIYAEFGQVICIALGFIHFSDKGSELRVKVLTAEHEGALLDLFANLLAEHYFNKSFHFMCGHNLKEFDVPFLCRRYRILGKELPELLDVTGHKPWQVHHLLDTMEMWKFGDYKYYTTLDMLCMALDIDSPKSEMTGSKVSQAFWNKRIEEITKYAAKDVVATVQVYLRLIGKSILTAEQIIEL